MCLALTEPGSIHTPPLATLGRKRRMALIVWAKATQRIRLSDFMLIKYSASAPWSFCKCQRLSFLAFLSACRSLCPDLSLYLSHPQLVLSGCCCHCVSAFCSSLSICIPRGLVHPLPTCMWASLPATVTPAQEVRASSFGGIAGTWACLAVFCFTFQSARCLGRETPQDCGNQKPCAEELRQLGCPYGRAWG